jgi:hypothetical protein
MSCLYVVSPQTFFIHVLREPYSKRSSGTAGLYCGPICIVEHTAEENINTESHLLHLMTGQVRLSRPYLLPSGAVSVKHGIIIMGQSRTKVDMSRYSRAAYFRGVLSRDIISLRADVTS